MNPPKTIKVGLRSYGLFIGGAKWKALQKVYKNVGYLYGETKHTIPRIIVRPDQDPILERSTVLHEILHALINNAGDLLDRYVDSKDGLEEFVCNYLESGLLALLRENPELVEYLTEDVA